MSPAFLALSWATRMNQIDVDRWMEKLGEAWEPIDEEYELSRRGMQYWRRLRDYLQEWGLLEGLRTMTAFAKRCVTAFAKEFFGNSDGDGGGDPRNTANANTRRRIRNANGNNDGARANNNGNHNANNANDNNANNANRPLVYTYSVALGFMAVSYYTFGVFLAGVWGLPTAEIHSGMASDWISTSWPTSMVPFYVLHTVHGKMHALLLLVIGYLIGDGTVAVGIENHVTGRVATVREVRDARVRNNTNRITNAELSEHHLGITGKRFDRIVGWATAIVAFWSLVGSPVAWLLGSLLGSLWSGLLQVVYWSVL